MRKLRKCVKILYRLYDEIPMKQRHKMPKKLLIQVKNNFVLIIICLVGAVLRFYNLGNIIFHLDEPMHTVQVAAKSLSYNLTHDFASMFYQFFAHFLLPLGKLEFVSRLPAALFGVLIILGTYYVGKLFFGRREGIIAALFVSFSHYLIRYSQYARAYTAFTFFSLLSFYFFYKAIKENKTKYWTLYLIFTVINIYTHLFTLVTVFSQISFVGVLLLERFIRFNKKKSWRIEKKRVINFIICTLLILLISYVLRLPVQVGAYETSTSNFMVNLLERIQNPPTIGLFSIIQQILTYQIYGFPSFLLFLALFFIFFGFIGCIARLRKEDALFLLYIGLPVLGFFLVKPAAVYFLVLDRYFIFILPLIFILSAKGITFLSSLFISLGSHSRIVKKREHVYQNLFLAILVSGFFLLECNTVKEYSDFVWKLRSLNVSKSAQTYLKNNVNSEGMIFFDSFPDKAKVVLMTPLFLNNGEKKLMIHAVNRTALRRIANLKIGLWLVLDRSFLETKMPNGIEPGLPKEEIRNVDGDSFIHWKKGEEPIIKNLIEMVEFLIPLHPDKGEEYRLLLTKFYLLDGNFEKANEELDIIEKTPSLHSDTAQRGKNTHPFLHFINKFIYSKNSRDLVLDSLHTDVARQLEYYGGKFLSEKKFNKALSAFDKYIQFSDIDHALVARRYVALGNRSLRLGEINEAISSLKKAIKLDPNNYIYHIILAEAFRKKEMMDKSIDEYRKVFNLPFLSEEFLRRIILKPRLFAIWKGEKTWHFMWKSDKKCAFSGKIFFNKGIRKIQRYHFVKKDKLDHYKNHAIEFNITTNQGGIKALDIHVGKNSQLTCYVQIDDQIVTDDIVFINSGENPKVIPFSISSPGKKNAAQIQMVTDNAEKIYQIPPDVF